MRDTILIGELTPMFLFYRLLLAHIIADFPSQTNQIFRVKYNTEWGGANSHPDSINIFNSFCFTLSERPPSYNNTFSYLSVPYRDR